METELSLKRPEIFTGYEIYLSSSRKGGGGCIVVGGGGSNGCVCTVVLFQKRLGMKINVTCLDPDDGLVVLDMNSIDNGAFKQVTVYAQAGSKLGSQIPSVGWRFSWKHLVLYA